MMNDISFCFQCKGKSDKTRKKKGQAYWMSTFIASDCTTTLAGDPAEKKRHNIHGKRVASTFVPRPKLVQMYYDGMPGTDIVNRNAQYLIALEEAIRVENIHKRMACTVLGTWMANAYGMAAKWLPQEKREKLTSSSFVKDVILGGLFPNMNHTVHQMHRFTSPSNNSIGATTINTNNTNNSTEVTIVGVGNANAQMTLPGTIDGVVEGKPIDSAAIDPYVHTMRTFAELGGMQRQQRCVTCYQEKRQCQTSYYCALCCITANREVDRKPSKHAYCINTKNQCFVRHIAACYTFMNRYGIVPAQRKAVTLSSTPLQAKLPIAGDVISRKIPKNRSNMKRHRKPTEFELSKRKRMKK
jgi:hypothetical protein